jgi:hypothetical protein
MNAVPKLVRLILFSPWFLLIFLAVPVLVILSLTLHLGLPLVGPRLLLGNNICFALLAACRLVWYLSRLGKGIRYGKDLQRPAGASDCQFSVAEADGMLAGAGYTVSADGSYAEKRDLGYLGTTVLYAGLFILLATGSWDNLRQFAGVVLDGPGPATKLNKLESYRNLVKGPLASKPDDLPQMRIISQILPDSTYPRGGTEIALIPEHGEPLTKLLLPTDAPLRYGSYDIYMTKLVFEPEIVIKTKDSRVLYDAFVKLDPLVQKRGDFSFYGLFAGSEVVGGAYYQPEKSLMMLVITRNGKKEVADMTFQVDQEVTKGDYVLSCAKMGQWSEIHVVHRRHREFLILGGVVALLGLVLRFAVRPQRVWLEGAGGACRVTAVGDDAKKLLLL